MVYLIGYWWPGIIQSFNFFFRLEVNIHHKHGSQFRWRAEPSRMWKLRSETQCTTTFEGMHCAAMYQQAWQPNYVPAGVFWTDWEGRQWKVGGVIDYRAVVKIKCVRQLQTRRNGSSSFLKMASNTPQRSCSQKYTLSWWLVVVVPSYRLYQLFLTAKFPVNAWLVLSLCVIWLQEFWQLPSTPQ